MRISIFSLLMLQKRGRYGMGDKELPDESRLNENEMIFREEVN